MTATIDNFVNELSAGMAHLPVEDYQKQSDNFLSKLDKIEEFVNKAIVKTVEQFKEVMEWKGMLSSLYCYTFNNKKAEHDRVSKLEDVLGKKLYQFAFSFRKVSPAIRPLAKYLLWNKHFRSENTEQLLKDANDAGILRKQGNSYLIIGMHLATGDNVFTISRRTGQQYRNYVKSCAIQAFYISFQEKRKRILDTMDIPELEDYYSTVGIGDHKYSAKISFNRKDRKVITEKYIGSW
jgi:hypothetical protein